jgi:sigma-B regulation protein RsbU (phosphoserine phosphatase)
MPMASPDSGAPGRWSIALESALAAAVAYLVAGVMELGLIRVFQPTELELTWVSDVLLAAAFGVAVYMRRHLGATRLELAARERAQLVLDTQLAVAAEMQRRLLPPLPEPTDGVAWAADLRPAGRIGGDFYDILRLADGRWLLLVADVSGKGVPAAMALSTVRAAFRSIAAKSFEPAVLLGQLSGNLYEQWQGGPYITAIVALIDFGHGMITYANAGHPAGVVAGGARVCLLDATGPAAALLPGAAYGQRRIAVRPGDMAVFVSDGVTEALGDEGAGRFQRLVASLARAGAPAAEACARVMSEARAGSGPEGVPDWQDDLTVVAVTMVAMPVTVGAGLSLDAADYAAVATRGGTALR